MIHTIDGCVPFLAPDILEQHFPPSDDLWLGMAVRDTCVLPVMPDNKGSSARQQRVGKDGKANERKNPRGYTFAPVAPDSWLLPYTRITVPSFDWMEENTRAKVKKEQRPESGSMSTNNHILVWTPHGRQTLTPELYAKASVGLKSSFTLSMYDMYEENTPKRVDKADARNKLWFQHLQKHRQDESGADDSLWSPILLPTGNESSNLILAHDNSEDVAGVALIGKWKSGMESVLRERVKDVPHVAILSTSSLSDILSIASSDIVDIIGTKLPYEWTQQKLAFAVDLSSSKDARKRPKLSPDSNKQISLNHDGCMDMSEKCFARDPNSLVPGCTCLACGDNRFSRAYVHHLICAKELLADIILFNHNLHSLMEMIRVFNTIEDQTSLLECIRSQIHSNNKDVRPSC